VLPTFVIGLREGVEASLIVGIVAAFLRQQGRLDALRWMWTGVGVAIALCIGVAAALQIVDDALPQRQQEGLETVVAAIAVGMVTFMIVWMRRHARNLAGELREQAAGALAQGSVWALVAMAFFAGVREGLETSVFLLAAFQASGNGTGGSEHATVDLTARNPDGSPVISTNAHIRRSGYGTARRRALLHRATRTRSSPRFSAASVETMR
jgi:high-affinity iron transporter